MLPTKIRNMQELYQYKSSTDRLAFLPARIIRFDNASGSFATFNPIRDAYKQNDSYAAYIDYNAQFIRQETVQIDWRNQLLRFLKVAGIVDETRAPQLANIITGFGTGYLFDKAVKIILKNSEDVIIVPTPTYGFCIPAIDASRGKAVFINLKEENNYQLEFLELERVIIDTNRQLFEDNIDEYMAKFAVLVRKTISRLSAPLRSKFSSLLAVTDYENSLLLLKQLKFLVKSDPSTYFWLVDLLRKSPKLPRVKGIYFINPNNPIGNIYSQNQVDAFGDLLKKYDLTVLEDLVHMEVRPAKKSIIDPKLEINACYAEQGFFGRAKQKVNQITLLSPSKALCAAECRIGFAYTSKEKWAVKIQELIFNDGLFLNRAQQIALRNAFNLSRERAKYLLNNNEDYYFRREFLRALVYGRKAKIDSDTWQKIADFLREHKLDASCFVAGVQGLEIINPDQEGGFFFVLDFSAFVGKYYRNLQLNSASDFFYLLMLEQVQTISGTDMYFADKAILRISFSLDPLQIFEGMCRILKVTRELSAKPILPEELSSQEAASSLVATSKL